VTRGIFLKEIKCAMDLEAWVYLEERQIKRNWVFS
jgi:hypothetical protein